MILERYSTVLLIHCACERSALWRDCLQHNRALYRLIEASSEAQGLELCQQALPDIILLDDSLPAGSCLTFLQEFQQQFGLAWVPIVVLVTQEQGAIGEQALEQGAQDYLIKDTLTADLLFRTLRSALRQGALQRQIVQQQAEIAALRAQQQPLEARQQGLEFLNLVSAPEWGETDATDRILREVDHYIRDRKQLEVALQDSEARFRSVFEQAAVGLEYTDLDGRFLLVNQQFCDIVGYTQAEICSLRFQDITHPDDLAANWHHFQQLVAGEITSYSMEKRFIRKDQAPVWVQLTVSLMRDPVGDFKSVLAAVQDVSERKRTEAALRQALQQLTFHIENTPLATIIWDANFRIQRWSKQAEAIFGWQEHEVLGKTIQDWPFIFEEDEKQVQAEAQRLIAGGTRGICCNRNYRKDGQVIDCEWYNSTLLDESGQLVSILSLAQDVSDRKRTETALLESQAKQNALLRALPDLIMRIDREGRYLDFITTSAFNVVGKPEDFIGNRVSTGLLPELAEQRMAAIQAALETGTIQIYEQELEVNGKLQTEEVRVVACGPQEALLVVRDISERKQAEEKIRRSEAALAQAQRIAHIGNWEFDLATQKITWSEELFRIYGYDPSQAEPSFAEHVQMLHPSDREHFIQTVQSAILTGEPYVLEFKAFRADGSLCVLEGRGEVIRDLRGRVIRLLGTVMDVTERKQAELALQSLLEGTASVTGEAFFPVLAEQIARALDVAHVFVLKRVQDQLVTLALYSDHQLQPNLTYPLCHTPCAIVLETGRYYCQRELQQQFPDNPNLARLDADSYLGTALQSSTGEAIGVLCVLDRKPMVHGERAETLLRIFASRVTAELERQQATEALLQLNRNLELKVEQRTAELRQSEAELHSIFSLAAVGIVQVDAAHYRFLKINQKFCDILGYTHSELAEKTFLDITHAEDLSANLGLMQQLQAGLTEEFTVEKRYLHKNTTLIWTSTTVSAVRQPDGSPDYYIAIIKDISDRKKAEQTLEAERLRLHIALQAAEMGTWECSLQPSEIIWSERVEAMFGYAPGTFPGDRETFLQLVCPEDRERVIQEIADCFETQSPYKIEYRIRRQDGQVRWLAVWGNVVQGTTETDLRMVGVTVDVTDRKQAEQALQDNEERLRLALIAANQGLYDLNTKTGVAIVSPEYATMLGYDPATFQETNAYWIERLHPDDRERVAGVYRAYVQGTIPEYKVEFRQRTNRGDWIWILSLGKIVEWDADGQPLRMLGTHTDINDRKQAEAALRQANAELESRVAQRTSELQKAKEAAEAANRAKSIFLANMSHELRTPLNAILGFSQLLAHHPALPPTQQEQIGIINRSGNHLLSLINNILEMSKIEAGRTTFSPTRFDLYDFLFTLEQMFQLRMQHKGLQLICDHAPSLPQYIETDEGKLRQILINLLGNAVKFTQVGAVTLRVWNQESGRDRSLPRLDRLFIEVSDTGPGIDPSELDSLFEPFVQSRNPSLNQEGTGLGLPISREFVHLLGGELQVSSQLGQGACFRFEIPITQVEGTAVVTRPVEQRIVTLAPNQQRHRILVVEDNWASRQLLLNLLQPLGFEVKAVINGQEAVNLWQQWQPDLIWMDIRMPLMDGYEATRQIRMREHCMLGTAPATKIVALTAGVFEEDRDRVIAAGCDDFVPKPLQEQVILEKLRQHLGVTYVYEELAAGQGAGGEGFCLEPGRLQVMSAAWLQEFYEAVTRLNPRPMLALVGQIPAEHGELAESLREKIHNFDFEQLMTLVQQAIALTHETYQSPEV